MMISSVVKWTDLHSKPPIVRLLLFYWQYLQIIAIDGLVLPLVADVSYS